MVTARWIDVRMAEGVAKAVLAIPDGAKTGMPGIILYMDAFGVRPALVDMAKRFAVEGYAVLVPDLFYRYPDKGEFDARTAFKVPETAAQLRSMISGTSQAMTAADTGAFIAALDEAGATGPVGTVGYCMGGGRAITAAGTYPDRIVAAASFHGGNLASDAEDSPHRLAGAIKGRVHVGMAGVDGSFPPEQAARLVEILHRANVDFTLESYSGMSHGWCIADHSVYDEAGAERHWQRVLTFLRETLGQS